MLYFIEPVNHKTVQFSTTPYSSELALLFSNMTSTVSDYVASFKSVLADFGNYFHATLISGTKGDAAVPKWMWVPVAAPIVYYSARYLWELATVTDLKNKVKCSYKEEILKSF